MIENWIFRIGGILLLIALLFILKDEDSKVPRETSIPSAIIFVIFVLTSIQSVYINGMHPAYTFEIIMSSLNAVAWAEISKWR